jgi:hypothetical protein
MVHHSTLISVVQILLEVVNGYLVILLAPTGDVALEIFVTSGSKAHIPYLAVKSRVYQVHFTLSIPEVVDEHTLLSVANEKPFVLVKLDLGDKRKIVGSAVIVDKILPIASLNVLDLLDKGWTFISLQNFERLVLRVVNCKQGTVLVKLHDALVLLQADLINLFEGGTISLEHPQDETVRQVSVNFSEC